jgi:hypothetical protein
MFDFLNSIQLVAVEEVKVEAVSRKLEYNPTNGSDFRLFEDGRIFPSEELVTKYNLEYTSKDDAKGNGFDVLSTKVWNWYPDNAPGHVILISAVSKALPKVDIFSTSRYNADGTPISSVVSQGASTFGKELITMLEDVYNPAPEDAEEGYVHASIFGDNKFIDLKIIDSQSVTTPNDIYYIPKMVAKGKNAGEIEHIRRENLVLNPLVIYTDEMASAYNTTSEDEIVISEVVEDSTDIIS